MNSEAQAPGSIIDAQVLRLLDIVQAYQKQQCDALLKDAEKESRAIIQQAYRQARRNIHEDIQLTRQHIRETMAAARARQHTLLMQQRHTAALSFLGECRGALEQSLQDRWRQAECRREWAAKILSTAAAVMPAGDWRVEHPEGWGAQEQGELAEMAQTLQGVNLQFDAQPGLVAGIRISNDGTSVDGSLSGLLADSTAIEALILATATRTGQRV
jgi:hypothetical protein